MNKDSVKKNCRENDIVNPDSKKVNSLIKTMSKNNGLCTCENNMSENKKCPCTNYTENGECICGLYLHKEGDGEKNAIDIDIDVEGKLNMLMEANVELSNTNDNLKLELKKEKIASDDKNIEIEKLKIQLKEMSLTCEQLRVNAANLNAKVDKNDDNLTKMQNFYAKQLEELREENFKLSSEIGKYEGEVEALKKVCLFDRIFNWKLIMECL